MHVAVDMDGTLADSMHRAYDAADPAKFYSLILDDTPIPEMVSLVEALIAQGHKITFITGRHEQARSDTLRWIHRYIPSACTDAMPFLYMRPNDDHTPNWEFKLSTCRWLKPGLIIDDDPDVAKVLYDDNFKVLLFLRSKEFTALRDKTEAMLAGKELKGPFPSHVHRERLDNTDIVQNATRDRADLESRRFDVRGQTSDNT